VKGNAGIKAPTLGDLVMSISSNQGFHQGQFAIIRRKLGKPVLY
jgi:hypothetical protein